MNTVWLTVNYLAGRIRRRIGLSGPGRDAGALSLEWIVIAVLLVTAAGIAYALFKNAITAEATKLP